MDQAKIEALFRQFAAPLAAYAATSPERKSLADMMARCLWTAMIAGPEMEEETWRILKTTGKLNDDSLQAIQQVYIEKMKPVVSEQERADLRQRYQMKRTGEV
jgi:hypothetical protein